MYSQVDTYQTKRVEVRSLKHAKIVPLMGVTVDIWRLMGENEREISEDKMREELAKKEIEQLVRILKELDIRSAKKAREAYNVDSKKRISKK